MNSSYFNTLLWSSPSKVLNYIALYKYPVYISPTLNVLQYSFLILVFVTGPVCWPQPCWWNKQTTGKVPSTSWRRIIIVLQVHVYAYNKDYHQYSVINTYLIDVIVLTYMCNIYQATQVCAASMYQDESVFYTERLYGLMSTLCTESVTWNVHQIVS